ncbi:glycosyltransferase [Halomonas sp. PR-M31]|uniref:glycosyltransferase n=1 Tax=Halomonas sp. PR-M31 TaxID=1471202 RepID=UPI000651E8CB|nr:glycosyltransferase [Halomonas sp. PR-M31]
MNGYQKGNSKTRWVTELTAFLVAVATLVIILTELPPEVFSVESESFILAIGVIGAWRYSWWMIQAVRSVWYNRLVFPELRKKADAVNVTEKPDALYVLCTSYRIAPEINFAVYDALIKDVADYSVPTLIFAAISDRSDIDVIDHVMAENNWPGNIEVRYMFQKGDGKRSAMAEVLRAISRRMPSHNSLLISMDGDIQIEPGTLSRSLSFFLLDQELGALTTNNRAIVNGGDVTREWYDLRYAQRHLVMSSMSLSERLLVLTGRYSAFRAELATHPDFIDLVENDYVDHWRFGKFKFLSGDDKSTWYWLLKNQWKMLYIPDVYVSGFEELPDKDRFFHSTIDLMKRWFGNMLRTSGRAIALGPKRMGFFTWWSLVDQRLSMWTTLIGPTVAILVTTFVRPSFIFAYIIWVIFTRTIIASVLALQRKRFSMLWVPLLYYNQVGGALLKTYISFRFNRQSWSRQGISAGEPSDPKAARRQRIGGHLIHTLYMGGMLTVLIMAVGVMVPPDKTSIFTFEKELGLRDRAPQGDSYWIAPALSDVSQGGEVHLPRGKHFLDASLFDEIAKLHAVRAASITGDASSTTHTTLLVAPEIASSVHGSEGQSLNETNPLQCGQQGECLLMTDQGPIELRNMEIRLDRDD